MASDIEQDRSFMRRALGLAVRGRGAVEPNPMVGCVIVRGGRVIGEGFHQRYGGPHAEAAALDDCTEDPRGATAYVTLEPCCHTRKKTPPCAPRLIAAGIARVVVGCEDPNPQVSGGGIGQLRSAGIAVDVGLLEAEAQQLIAAFFCRMRLDRPYVTMKWAESADGRVAGAGGRPVRISNAASWRAVHLLRAGCDAIAVGINTVLTDDPLLTARDVGEARPLLRVVLDRRLRIPLESRIVRTAGDHPACVVTAAAALAREAEKVGRLRQRGVEVLAAGGLEEMVREVGRWDLTPAGRRVGWKPPLQGEREQESVTHLLIEAGPTLAAAVFEANLADRVWRIRSPRRIDQADAPAAPALPGHFQPVANIALDGDELIEYLNTRSAVYFAPAASADIAKLNWYPRL